MKDRRRRWSHSRLLVGLLLAVVTAACSSSQAEQSGEEDFPTRGIELTLGFGPGSGIDSNARMLAPHLEKALGVPVTVINRPGGSAVPWANSLARAKPDGYTIGMIGFPLLQNNSVLTEVAYDPTKDFSYLGVLTLDPAVIAVDANSSYRTIDDLIAAAKANPAKVSIGATGKGSVDYLIALSIERKAGVKYGIVNFDSTNEGVNALLSGSLDAMPMTVSAVLSFVQSGKVRVLAAGADTRVAELPNVPTFSEAGVDLLADGSYRAFIAPAGLPEKVHATLVKGIKTAIDDPEFVEKAKAAGMPIVYMTPEEEEKLSKDLVDAARAHLK